jgi:hypothetical protein
MKRFASALAAIALTLGVAVAAPAVAAGGPVVATGTASSVTASSATLTATVDPNASATSYYFEYGPTTAYGAKTAVTPAGSGDATVAVQAPVKGLSSDTSYHFRIVASNGAGTATGADATFTTAKLPPTVTTASATAVTGASATLNATVDPNGKATSYAFQYGPTTAYGTQTAMTSAGSGTAAASVHTVIKGLVSNTAYHFRVVATNADGTSVGADATVTTAAVPPTISRQRVSFVNASSADVSVEVNANGKTTTYTVEYGPTAAYGLQTAPVSVGTTTKGVLEHSSMRKLSRGTLYYYRVVATSADGTTVGPADHFETTGTPGNPSGPLPAVSQAAAAKVGAHGAQLNGAINPRGPRTTWYFEVGRTSAYGLQTHRHTITGFGAHAVNDVLTGLQQGSVYHFRLVAYSPGGLYVGPDHTFTTKRGQRMYTRGVAVYASTHLLRNVVVVNVHGRLRLPASVSTSEGCAGTIGLQVRRDGETIHVRHTSIRADCRYSASIYILRSRLRGSPSVTVEGYYWGNSLLKPARAFRNVLVR